MNKPIDILYKLFNFEQLDEHRFSAISHNTEWQRIYGGQVIAQALYAANLTVTQKPVHSLHCYFILAGDPKQPLIFEVEKLRDGRSFDTRQVKALQNDKVIFILTASFHHGEESFDHHDIISDVARPHNLPSIDTLIEKYKHQLPETIVQYFNRERPFEMRPVDISRYFNPKPAKAEQFIWLKTNGSVTTGKHSDTTIFHQAALAYASDFTLLDTALIAHGKLLFDKTLMLASLDHSIWFHRPFRVDEWLLYRQTSPNAYGGRGLCFGQFYDLEGRLIASTTQEGLTRIRH